MRVTLAAALIAGLSGPALAQDVAFDGSILEACLTGGDTGGGGGFGGGSSCIGAAVEPCIDATPGGATTVGYAFCLDAELSWWDARLNAVYRELLSQAGRIDVEAVTYGTPNRPSDVAALRRMQRAWIEYRDESCGYEALQWWGGTGANGVSLSCRMRLTGAQSFYLEGLLLD